jgi:hypothetical protein
MFGSDLDLLMYNVDGPALDNSENHVPSNEFALMDLQDKDVIINIEITTTKLIEFLIII